MRVVAGVVFAFVGLLCSYWALVSWTRDPIEWIFVSAFVWLMCHDLWQRLFNRDRGPSRGGLAPGSPGRRRQGWI
jgi:hypothetical protein